MSSERTIKYHNDLADIPLLGLTATHANVFMITCFRYQHDLAAKFQSIDDIRNCPQEQIPYIEYNISDFLKLCQYKKGGPKKFIQEMKELRRRLGHIGVDIEEEDVDVGFPFFYEFRLNKKEKTFRVQIHKQVAYMLFGLKRDYTQHDIDEFVSIKSIYAKRCYKQLKRWRTVGRWQVSIDEFKRYIEIPDSCMEARNMDKRILGVIKTQLAPFFQNLTIEKSYGSGKGKPVSAITISFTPEEKNGDVKRTSHICPKCGRPLVEKVINGNACWCHEDGWKSDAECKQIYNAVSDIYENNNEKEEVQSTEELDEKLKEAFNII